MPREILVEDVQENIDTNNQIYIFEAELNRLQDLVENYKNYTKDGITYDISRRYTELLQGRTDFQNDDDYRYSVETLNILIQLINKIVREDNQFSDGEKKNFATIKDFFQSKVAEFNRVATERGYYLPRTQGGNFLKKKTKNKKNTRTRKLGRSRKTRKVRKSRKSKKSRK
jgi:hypothetical protein